MSSSTFPFRSMFFHMCGQGNICGVSALLQLNPLLDYNYDYEDNYTPLHNAISKHQVEMVEFLLNLPKINTQIECGGAVGIWAGTPLDLAISQRTRDGKVKQIISLLVEFEFRRKSLFFMERLDKTLILSSLKDNPHALGLLMDRHPFPEQTLMHAMDMAICAQASGCIRYLFAKRVPFPTWVHTHKILHDETGDLIRHCLEEPERCIIAFSLDFGINKDEIAANYFALFIFHSDNFLSLKT